MKLLTPRAPCTAYISFMSSAASSFVIFISLSSSVSSPAFAISGLSKAFDFGSDSLIIF